MPKKRDHRDGLFQLLAHHAGTFGADQIIRIHAFGHQAKPQGLPSLDQRQSQIYDAHRSPQPGLVAIQRNDRFVMDTPKKLQLIFRYRRSKRGNRCLEPGFGQGDDVHVPLGHDKRRPFTGRLACWPMIIETAPLVEERCFRRVQVFGVVVRIHGPTAKGNRPSTRIANGEHDPVPEGVVGAFALIGRFRKTRFKDQLLIDAFARQVIPKTLPTIWREADFPPFLCGLVQTTSGKVVPRSRRRARLELKAIELDSLLHHLGQLCPVVRLFLRLRVPRRHRHAAFPRQNFHCLYEADVLGFLDKTDGITFRVAPKTVVKAFTIIDVETCRLFLMKGARRPHVALALI